MCACVGISLLIRECVQSLYVCIYMSARVRARLLPDDTVL